MWLEAKKVTAYNEWEEENVKKNCHPAILQLYQQKIQVITRYILDANAKLRLLSLSKTALEAWIEKQKTPSQQ